MNGCQTWGYWQDLVQCVKPEGFIPTHSAQLPHFADGSEDGDATEFLHYVDKPGDLKTLFFSYGEIKTPLKHVNVNLASSLLPRQTAKAVVKWIFQRKD